MRQISEIESLKNVPFVDFLFQNIVGKKSKHEDIRNLKIFMISKYMIHFTSMYIII